MKSNSIELKELYDSIINSTFLYHKDSFKVFTYEAATGKTTTICNALNDLYIKSLNTRTLIVTKLKVEQEMLKEKLGHKAKVINGDYKIKEENLYTYPILIITHELYRRLCKDYERRQYYIKGRTNLIIDEQLDLLEVREFNSIKADEMRANLSKVRYSEDNYDYELNEMYGKIIYQLNDVMHQNYQSEMKFVNIIDDKIIDKVDFLKDMLEKGDFPKGLRSKRQQMINEIDFIRHFYNNEYVIACNGRLYSFNNKIDYFMLNNNILLDASGSFLELYNESDKFKVKDFGRIVNHSNTTLTFIEENSTTSAIERDSDKYFEGLIQYIKTNTEKGDKVLLIGRGKVDGKETVEHLKELTNLNDRIIEFVNFDAMRGKNDWADFNKCFIIHLPNLPFHHYVYQYLYYTENRLSDEDLKLQKIDTNFGFINSEILESFRVTDVVSNIYQALKRVNRKYNTDNKCELYVMTNNKRIQELIIKQFKGLKDIRYDEIFGREYNNNKRIADSLMVERANNINEFFNSMKQEDKIKKKLLRQKVNAKDNKQFLRALEYLGGDKYLKEVGVEEVGHRYIKIV